MFVEFKGENITKQEFEEIQLAEYKVDFYSSAFPRFADDLPNHVPYRHTQFINVKEKTHKGQLKLLLSEIDFLVDYARHGTLVIYVGAAQGYHINELYDKFKHLELVYHLYDLTQFDVKLYEKENIHIFSEYFTDDHCDKYKEYKDNKEYKDILFMCDMRNLQIKKGDDVVPEDMNMQMKWVLMINPRASMLKFRLPYSNEQLVEYLKGEVRLQAYAPSSTNECRLVSERPYEKKMYDPLDNESRLFYLNKIIRHWYEYDKFLEEYIMNKYNEQIQQFIHLQVV